MRRLVLFAIGLSAMLWMGAARPVSVLPHTLATISSVDVCAVAHGSHGPSESNRQWDAHQQPIVAVTESLWKSVPVHAVLAAARSPIVFDPAPSASAPDPPRRSAPSYLRHTPLLI